MQVPEGALLCGPLAYVGGHQVAPWFLEATGATTLVNAQGVIFPVATQLGANPGLVAGPSYLRAASSALTLLHLSKLKIKIFLRAPSRKINSHRWRKVVTFPYCVPKVRRLSHTLNCSAGRNQGGSITVRHHGGRALQRRPNTTLLRLSIKTRPLLLNLVHQGGARPLAGLLKYPNGALSYITVPHGVIPGWRAPTEG